MSKLTDRAAIGYGKFNELISLLPSHGMLLVVGHPGAGKTTLASQICYASTLEGKKCLYISFYEDKERLFINMENLGINLREAEGKELLVHVKLPVASTEELLNAIAELASKDTYSIVVIDSINVVLELIERKEQQRAVLLNFFYQLLSITSGLLVVLAEIPLGRETLELGSIEFVADAVIYLKHRIERGLLMRILEIRKLRGVPIIMAEVPFVIAEREGVKPIFPPRPERTEATLINKLNVLEITEELLGTMYAGDIIFISYPPYAKEDPLSFVPLIDIAIENNLKVLFISYSYSVHELRYMFTEIMTNELNLKRSSAEKVLKKFFFFGSINPAVCIVPRLIATVTEFAKGINPGVVVLHSTELLNPVAWDLREYWVAFFNLFLWLKNQGVLVVRYSSRTDSQWIKVNEALSQIVVRIYYKFKAGNIEPLWYTWSRSKRLKVIDFGNEVIKRKVNNDVKKLAEIIESIGTT